MGGDSGGGWATTDGEYPAMIPSPRQTGLPAGFAPVWMSANGAARTFGGPDRGKKRCLCYIPLRKATKRAPGMMGRRLSCPSYSQWLLEYVKTVRYSPDALRSLRRYGSVAARARKAVEEYVAVTGAYANNITRLVGSTACRLRIGDFRVIFEESDTDIVVTKFAPRGDAYD
jgi:mRNA interferase RelE/StbE